MRKLCLIAILSVCTTLPFLNGPAYAQSITSGDISGTVTDSSGAAIPHAGIEVTKVGTGQKTIIMSKGDGTYRVSLLSPGMYHIVISTIGFETTASDVYVTAGTVITSDTKLQTGSTPTTIEVTESAPLLQTESAEISTEFNQEQIASLPNPGNDLTFVAQTAPGAVMNTQGGYGNFASFGLPGTANTFTINGGSENDPFLNINVSGATNLLLGNNDVGTVTVLSNAYGAQYGGLGGTQVNEITRSGTNKFHGDATYQWNGSALNANDFFNNQTGVRKPRSNANQWSGAFGGPLLEDRTFFFFNTEGLRVTIPVRAQYYAPNAGFIATTEAHAQTPVALAFYQAFFNQYQTMPGYATAAADTGDPNAVTYSATSTNFAHEAQYTGRIDQRLGDKDNLFIHGTYDTGTQPRYTSLVNPIFDALSPQPQYSGQLSETHTFSPTVVNQFVFAEIYYKAIFQNTNSGAANGISPFTVAFLTGDLANNGYDNPGGEDALFPQGEKVNGYQFIDDLSITRGKHTLKLGFFMRRDDVTDEGPQVFTTPLVEATEASFEVGTADMYVQQFPTRLTQPVSTYNLGIYVQDQWKPTKDFVFTAGLRFEHNSNPVCQTDCFARFPAAFSLLSTNPATPYSNAGGSGLIDSGLRKSFADLQKVAYEPRIGFAYTPSELGSKTVVRGGLGVFASAIPSQVADDLLNNAPTNVGFTIFGPAAGGAAHPLFPGVAGSFAQLAASSNSALQTGYAAGGSNATLSAAITNFAQPGFVSPVTKIHYPTYEEYNLAIEQQVGKSTILGVDYVGNHTYHQPVLNTSANAFNGGAAGFASLPTAAPNPNFSAVDQIYSGASSNYNGVVLTVSKRASYLTLQFNYTYSHALDEISNGGFDGFSGNSTAPTNPNPAELRENYGNADYDTRHYISANYVFSLPYYGGPKVLAKGWEFAGTVFHSSGLPFTFTDGVTAASFGNYGGALYAKQTVAHIPTKCSGHGNENSVGANPCAAAADFSSATDFGQQERNQVFGPSYTDTDMSVYKSFEFPHYATAHLETRRSILQPAQPSQLWSAGS